jgi:chorismate mutase
MPSEKARKFISRKSAEKGAAIGDNDSELKTLRDQINKEHGELLASFRKGMNHALRVGALLDAVKAKLGHGSFNLWIADNCKFSLPTAKLYRRLHRLSTEMPEMRDKILDLDLNSAPELLREERDRRHWDEYHRCNAPRLDHDALVALLRERVDDVTDVAFTIKARMGDAAWNKWTGRSAEFLKQLCQPPDLEFPEELKPLPAKQADDDDT